MISLCDDCEYTILIADLIETLASMKKFVLRIWIGSNELPLMFNHEYDVKFLQEGIRIQKNNVVEYIFYDVITEVRVIDES